MARTSKAMAVLDERIATLRHAVAEAQANYKSVHAQLEEVLGLRDKVERAAPKRTSRAKRTQTVLAASVAGDSKATAS
jgi:hypothetical protein